MSYDFPLPVGWKQNKHICHDKIIDGDQLANFSDYHELPITEGENK